MANKIVYPLNDAFRMIADIAESIRDMDEEGIDPRVRAMILTKLQEARLLSLELVANWPPQETPAE